ncbi:MAG: EF-Tu/IF-2/RF-3 family GTPase [Armatimonadota bacterium]
MEEKYIGSIAHYFSHLSVAAMTIEEGELKVGDKVHIKGHTTDLITTIESLETEHHKLDTAKPGDDIGFKVPDHVREHDKVYKITGV